MSKKTIKLKCSQLGEREFSYDTALNLLRYQEKIKTKPEAAHYYSLSDSNLDFQDGKIISTGGTKRARRAKKQKSDSKGRSA